MRREELISLSLAELREKAKQAGIKSVSVLRKPDLIAALSATEGTVQEAVRKAEPSPTAHGSETPSTARGSETPSTARSGESSASARTLEEGGQRPTGTEGREPAMNVEGILEVRDEGFGFLRGKNYLPTEHDVYIAPSIIKRFNLRTGDILTGVTREKTALEKFAALGILQKVNGMALRQIEGRKKFENMTPVFPNERLRLERHGSGLAMRLIDLLAPIGKGQRGMIVSPPKAGKTTLLKDVAKSILRNNPEVHLIILLIDERPEEVTDMKESIKGSNVEVIHSTFDEKADNHVRVSEMTVERARRLVESHRDVVILLDSITRLTRAYNLVVPASGRTLSGGLDPASLHMPKRFFGAARNMKEKGSLTILATALIDTGSRMDDVVYEEFKGTGNMEVILDRRLSERRIFPAVDIPKSSTRREDLLLDQEEQEAVYRIRRAISTMRQEDAVEKVLELMSKTKSNREFCAQVMKEDWGN